MDESRDPIDLPSDGAAVFSDEAGPHPGSRWYLVFQVCLWLLGLLLAGFVYLWFCTPPRVPTAPIHLARTGTGPLEPTEPGSGSSGGSFEAYAGKMVSQNNFSSTSSVSESDQARFACARIVVFNRSSHLLMARVGQRLLEHFKPLGCIRQYDYYPAGFQAEAGQLAPDLVLTLDLAKLVESTGLTASTLEATVTVHAGNAPPDCHNSCVDHLTPPLASLGWSGRLEHQSTTTGVTSSAARYQQVADDIAKQIATTLSKEFADRLKKHTALPDLSADFYPSYRIPMAVPLDGLGEREELWSWHGLMNHNETLWRITTERSPIDVISELQKRLRSAGWSRSDGKIDPTSPFLRIYHGAVVLQAYPVKRDHAAAELPNIVYVHYLDRMTKPEIEAAIAQAMAGSVPTDVLTIFQRHWSRTQQEEMLKRLRTARHKNPQAAMTLAQLYHRLGQDAEAKRELLRGQVLLRTVGNLGSIESSMKSLAKELGDERLLEPPIDLERLHDTGFVDLKPGSVIPPREVVLDEPLLFVVQGEPDANGLRTLALRASKDEAAPTSPVTLAHVDATDHGRSWGTSGSDFQCTIRDEGWFWFKIEPIPSKNRFRIVTEWKPAEDGR